MDIKKFLQSSYSYESFEEFIFEKFYGFEVNDNKYEEPLTETEQIHIEKYRFLGSCELDDGKDIGFFEVVTNERTDIENNRVSLNNILTKRASDELLDSAIAVFYNPMQPKVWRLSFIKFSYDENNKEQVSNLKRYTYVLGENIPIKTAYTQLKDLKYPSLNELSEAFSVEKISKEFFTKYKNLYTQLVRDIKVVNQNKITDEEKQIIEDEKTVSFYIKKLLGRVVFLYFVQKKGWLNNNRKFISELYTTHTKENPEIDFYDEIMETLFFNALNTKRDNDKIILGGKNYRIPYLNGGLFESDEFDDKNLTIPNQDFKQILELFDSYNFTVIEDIPHDSEIAIDPEMLGRVFEDLLEDRKEKGAYYTPREVVHYMCQESIVNYLLNFYGEEYLEDIRSLILEERTDKNSLLKKYGEELVDKLLNIKVLDPAIGSGAFPMGMLHEIVQIVININKGSNVAKLKRKVIENCIYGIDIENSAVEIAKLRFWLSIVVDEEEPTPLPNLKYKIMVGNSLIETVNGYDPLSQHGNTKEIKFLKNKFHKYFNTNDNREKEIINLEIKNNILTVLTSACRSFDIQPRFDMDKKEQKKYEDNLEKYNQLKTILDDYKKYNCTTKLFLYKVYFKEVLDEGGFDIVIGNPPYIKEATNKSAFDGTRHLECYQGKLDIWYLFGSKGINLLKDKGILSFIATNNWISNAGASKFRNKVLTTTRIQEFIDFGDYKVFESAGIQTMILITKKTKSIGKYQCQYSKIINKNIEKKDLVSFLSKREDKKFSFFKSSINPNVLLNKNITFLESKISFILDKIELEKNFSINGKNEIFSGIDFPQDILSKKSQEVLGSDYEVGDGIFVLTNEELESLNLNDNEKKLIKPYYTTNELDRYLGKKENSLWVIYTNSTFKHKSSVNAYPNIKRHLDKFKDIITSENKPYGLNRARDIENFQEIKIISKRKCPNRPSFTYTDFDTFFNRTFMIIKSDRINLKYLTAILNSKLITFWLKYKGKMQGDNYQVDKEPILNLPIKNIENTKPFEILVDYIRFIKLLKNPINEYVSNEHISNSFEEIIDGMIFEIYFSTEFKDKNLNLINYVEKDFKEISNLTENEKSIQVDEIYSKIKEPYNEIRNNLILIDTELKNIMIEIKKV